MNACSQDAVLAAEARWSADLDCSTVDCSLGKILIEGVVFQVENQRGRHALDHLAALLDRECRAALLHHGRVELDCAAVDFMDQRGIEVMKSLPRKQVTLIGAPGFVMELLQTGGRS